MFRYISHSVNILCRESLQCRNSDKEFLEIVLLVCIAMQFKALNSCLYNEIDHSSDSVATIGPWIQSKSNSVFVQIRDSVNDCAERLLTLAILCAMFLLFCYLFY